MSKNITYLFGAGASYNAVPVVNEMSDAFSEVIEYVTRNLIEVKKVKKPDEVRCVQEFIDNLNHLRDISKEFNTIDTYTRKLVFSI